MGKIIQANKIFQMKKKLNTLEKRIPKKQYWSYEQEIVIQQGYRRLGVFLEEARNVNGNKA